MTSLENAIRTERQALISFFETLTPEQWTTPSLCAGWRVQDVAGHLAWATGTSGRELVGDFLRSRARLNQMFADAAVRWSRRGPEVLLAELRWAAETGAKAPGMPEAAVLVDAVLHGLDVRRPLGASRPVPAEVFRRTADFCVGARWPTSMLLGGAARERLAGLRLVAEDQDWAHGAGMEVRASGEVALLVMAGRPVRPGELTGPGAATLGGRL